MERLQAPPTIDGQDVIVSVRSGIAAGAGETVAAATLLRRAEVALSRARAAGRGRAVVWDRDLVRDGLERLCLEAELRLALERNEFLLHYQPVVRLADGRVCDVEALPRRQHPRRGLLSADVFVPLAEESGLICAIGRWALAEACRQAQAWQPADTDRPAVTISVNLSACQLQQRALVDEVQAVLVETGLDPGRLKLELTESVLVQQSEQSLAALHRLRQLGIRLAIADFGAGYASPAYVKTLPVDALKIDRLFVRDLGRDRGTRRSCGRRSTWPARTTSW